MTIGSAIRLDHNLTHGYVRFCSGDALPQKIGEDIVVSEGWFKARFPVTLALIKLQDPETLRSAFNLWKIRHKQVHPSEVR